MADNLIIIELTVDISKLNIDANLHEINASGSFYKIFILAV